MLGVFYDEAHPDETLAEIEDELAGCVTQMDALVLVRDAVGRVTGAQTGAQGT